MTKPKLLIALMKLTGFRFSKDYRWGTTAYHRVVYWAIDTIGCNWACEPEHRIEPTGVIQ